MLTACVATGVQLRTDLDSGVFDRFKVLPDRPHRPAGRPDGRRHAALLHRRGPHLRAWASLIGYRPGGGFAGVAGAILLAVVAGWSLAWIFTFFGLVGRNAQGVQGISLLVMFPLTFLSNAFVPTDTMPRPLEAFAEVNPVSLVITALRDLANDGQVTSAVGWALLGCAVVVGDLRPAVGAPLQEDVSQARRSRSTTSAAPGCRSGSGAVGQLLDELRRSVPAAPRPRARPSAPTPSPGCCGCRPSGGRSPAGVRRPRAAPAGRTAAIQAASATSMTPLSGQVGEPQRPVGQSVARPQERCRAARRPARPASAVPCRARATSAADAASISHGLMPASGSASATIVDDVVVAPDRARVVAAGERQLGLRGLPGQPGAHLGGLPVRLAELLEHRRGPVDVAVEQRRDRRGHPQAVGVGQRVHPREQRPGDLGVVRRRGGGRPTAIASWLSSACSEAVR